MHLHLQPFRIQMHRFIRISFVFRSFHKNVIYIEKVFFSELEILYNHDLKTYQVRPLYRHRGSLIADHRYRRSQCHSARDSMHMASPIQTSAIGVSRDRNRQVHGPDIASLSASDLIDQIGGLEFPLPSSKSILCLFPM